MNKVFLSGNLTRDPEIKYTANGKAMARMGIAVQRRFKNQETGQADVDFFNLTAWEKTAEFCGRYLRKGTRVIVEGSMRTYNYVGQDGAKRSGVDIWVDNIEFAGAKRSEGDTGNKYADSPNRYDSKPSAPASDNDFDSGDNFVDDEFIGQEIPNEKVPF